MTDPAPLSKTAKYKKITKPLLERKRRARINRCLDELKDLMVGALEIDDDNLSKLEKADILELTVNHLTKLHSPKDPVLETKKFQAGFGQCAAEACRFIMSVPDLDAKVSQNLISHLSRLITVQPLTIQVPERPPFSPPTSPASVISDRHHYYSDHERSSSDAEDSIYSGDGAPKYSSDGAPKYSSDGAPKYSSDGAPKQWGYSRQNQHATRKPTAAMTGLLTTVDKLMSHQPEQTPGNGHRHGQYFNKVPAEAKDVILQKIRQHIMDKRGNEYCNVDVISSIDEPDPRHPYKNETYRNEVTHQFSPAAVPTNDTLDLRKFRSPSKSSETACSLKQTVAHPASNQSDATPLAESKIEAKTNLPEQCELPMDYSNLPPKKKRKLIEYQEYKKQEEARRQLEAFYAEKKRHGGPPDEDAKWRPW